jgi:uncharacterized membrane protein
VKIARALIDRLFCTTMMNWQQRYRVREFFRSSLWPLPLAAMLAAPILARGSLWVDRQLGWTLNLTADAARAVFSSLIGSLLAFIVLIFTILLVAIQLASAQVTPRIIARVFKDRVTKFALSVFVFSYTFMLVIMGQLGNPVPMLSGLLAGYGSLVCLAVFLFLVDRLGKELRPVRILTAVAAEGRAVISAMYPERIAHKDLEDAEIHRALPGNPTRIIEHRGAAGVLLAFDDVGLLALAQESNCIIELVPQVGDFVAADDPLFRIYPPLQTQPTARSMGSSAGHEIDERVLRQSIALGAERTLKQDPAFAFRIIVDIGAKALSPAINDPTTAVLAIDQLHRLLRHVGLRRLDNGQDRDSEGQLRFIYRTPNWEDFVQLAVTEIRQFGGSSIQITRRLRAMLENLVRTVPLQRTALLQRELELLHRTVERLFAEPEDRAMAHVSDSQGMGGNHD